MPELLHQTTRLSGGRHNSPEDGMCVAELASLLAGEPFTDQPESVSRTIGAFVRTYNDRVDPVRRQDLVPYAALIVGTRADLETERRRAARCVAWAAEAVGARIPAYRRRMRRLAAGQPGGSPAFCELAARWAAWRVPLRNDAAHRAVLRLLDDLVDAQAVAPPAVPIRDAARGPARRP